ncbi:Threonine--tRNA ligase [Nymphon striatum]|nr:Threonine--tRNA ligase [Nymphon striatum]
MSSIVVQLPDGSERELAAGATAADLAADIGPGLAKAALIATVNGEERDLNTELTSGATVALITETSPEGLETLRHSTSHVLAQAVLELWPGATFAIGPPIENGFYYDFELPDSKTFAEEDLERIEAKMHEIIAADQPFVRGEVSAAEGLELFADHKYKRETIERVTGADGQGGADADMADEVDADGTVSFYRNSDSFVDLCRGPHVPSTGRLGHFKLMSVAGAYWRGRENEPMLQRIYGTAWASKKDLKRHLQHLEEAAKRDHRKLANELDLVSWPSELGPGLAVWHPKGALVRKLMEDYSRDRHEAGGYDFAYTPHIAKSVLWETSGHLDFYADGMYPPMELDGATYYPKPMNCPFHVMIYKKKLASLLEFVLSVLRAFGFTDFQAKLSTRPEEKSVGDDEIWELATDGLRAALETAGLDYVVDEGGGAFYGPKIDVDVKDAIGRAWQLSTIQADFTLPERFDLEYVASDGERKRPVMIHRALFGSVERFFGVLLEHYAGAFPVWLSPMQVQVLPVAEAHDEYGRQVTDRLKAAGYRAELVAATDPLGKRVRAGKSAKLPYVLVVGDDDVANGTVGVNARGQDVERDVTLDAFEARLANDLETRV